MNEIEKLAKIEEGMDFLKRTIIQMSAKMDQLFEKIYELETRVSNREVINGMLQSDFADLNEQFNQLRKDTELLKRQVWYIVGGLITLQFIIQIALYFVK